MKELGGGGTPDIRKAENGVQFQSLIRGSEGGASKRTFFFLANLKLGRGVCVVLGEMQGMDARPKRGK